MNDDKKTPHNAIISGSIRYPRLVISLGFVRNDEVERAGTKESWKWEELLVKFSLVHATMMD
jgi:hypothetical protein